MSPLTEEEIFAAAVEKSLAERAEFLDRACAGNAALRAQVETLLKAHDAPDGLLDKPGVHVAIRPADCLTEGPDTQIGPYKLLEQIGEGGMGLVFMAEQQRPIRRLVALKIIKPGMDSRQVITRFEAERQALAMMDHPHIARVLDAGTNDTGRPYFVMELVRGIPITEFCDQKRLPVRERLELFIQVCQAIQHAHQKGIIHRDLKPNNVLVTMHDAVAVPKVIDFGIAKALGQQLTEHTLHTGFAQLVGTPLYMSPEQAEMNQFGVDTRSDVYSLGVMLYELLTGTTPFDKDRLKSANFEEMRRIIREEDPSRPSTCFSTLDAAGQSTAAGARGTDSRQLSRQLRGELDWLVMKCLDKDRDRRYESANGLARDIERHLNDEAVLACPPSAGYRLRKFARRHQIGLAITGLVLCFFVLLGGSVGWVLRDWHVRQTVAESLVVQALSDAEPKLPQGNPHDPELVTAARKAEAQLASGVVRVELRNKVDQLLADLAMLTTLENIRLEQAVVMEEDNRFDSARADPAYAQVFREYGINVEALGVEEAAEQIRQSAIGMPLALALDNWAIARRVGKQSGEKGWRVLLQVARAADPDPWRCSLREALISRKEKEDLQKLVGAAPLPNLPPTTMVILGGVLGEVGATESAVKVLRQGQHFYPADFWINEALAWQLGKMRPPQLDEAISFHRAALALRPQCPGVHFNLGNALKHKGRLDEAKDCFREAVRLKPNYAAALSQVGVVSLYLGHLDEAIAADRSAIELRPDDWCAYINLGIGLSRKGKLDEGIAAFRKAIQLEPGIALSHSQLAKALSEKGDLAEAIAALRKAIKLKPDFAYAWNEFAWLRATSPDPEVRDSAEAVKLAQKAVALAPKQGTFWNTLGVAHYRAGDWESAIDALEKSMELLSDTDKSDEAINMFFVAMAHWQLNHKDEARNRYDQAVERMDKNQPKDEDLLRFRAEAAELLDVKDEPASPEPRDECAMSQRLPSPSIVAAVLGTGRVAAPSKLLPSVTHSANENCVTNVAFIAPRDEHPSRTSERHIADAPGRIRRWRV